MSLEVVIMAIPTPEQFRKLAMAENGEPVSAGGPPFRDLTSVRLGAAKKECEHESATAPVLGARESMSSSGTPVRDLDKV